MSICLSLLLAMAGVVSARAASPHYVAARQVVIEFSTANAAQDRFQAAVDGLPDHIGALEGLALVAATKKRYPVAREHLRHLLRLRPESSTAQRRLDYFCPDRTRGRPQPTGD
ncbi:MAG: hypothetical protein KAY37_00615 [Phycisphaerae bacterium]|nr:hypothetical protein [Phycisphaerae bacterium]